jgi:hypothetical protein
MSMSAETGVERVCPECGGDRYRARMAQRDLEAAQRHRRSAEDIARENGLLRYKLAVAETELRDSQSLQQRKIVRQARAIRRLEEKLRKRGEKPYEGASLDETAPGAEHEHPMSDRAPVRPLPAQ